MSKLMFGTSTSVTVLLQLAAVVLLALSSVNGAKIDIINKCIQPKTVCVTDYQTRLQPPDCFVLNGGGATRTITRGSLTEKWEAGLIWAFNGNSGSPTLGNQAKPQANLAEITIGGFTAGDGSKQDSYDISNVDAYNLPMRIAPTQLAPGAGTPGGTHCTPIVCNIPYSELNAFCQPPNFLTLAPGMGCKNKDGPGIIPTAGTRAFKARCPTSYSYSKDDAGTVFGCKTGTDYQVVFCP
jgi:hypothetical protein